MKKNVNFQSTFGYIPKFEDGSIIVCQVDQFPVKDKTLYKENGFPRSDIGIVDRMSSLDLDKELIEQISSRMMDTSARSPYEGLSDDEMLRVLRPACVQTATEYKYYAESVYQIMREKSEMLKKSDTTTTTSVDVKDDASDEVALVE